MFGPQWRNLLSALAPSFGTDQHGRAREATFRLIVNLMRALIVLIAIWAIAAGFLQTGRLIQYIPRGFPGEEAAGFWARQINWLGPLLGVPVYTFKAFGVAMLIGLAAAMIGGLLGFLFGLPRMATEAATQTPAPSAAVTPAGVAGSPSPDVAAMPAGPPVTPFRQAASGSLALRGRGWQSSTNLAEIADWLTKIIVGVGLVEAKAIYDQLTKLSHGLGGLLFNGAAGSELIIPAVIIAAALLGFLYAYLYTLLVVAGLVAWTDAELINAGGSADHTTLLPPDIQGRKQAFSDYIQSLVTQPNRDLLDRIAGALEVTTSNDLL